MSMRCIYVCQERTNQKYGDNIYFDVVGPIRGWQIIMSQTASVSEVYLW